jgi:hypothetical protein
MKKYIYSPHHQGLVLAPLMTEPNQKDYWLTDPAFTVFNHGEFDEAMEAYNTWLSSPPIYKVRPEDIKDFLEPIDESQFEVDYQVLTMGSWRDTTKFVYDQYMNTDCKRIVAIPKKGNESKEQSPSVEHEGGTYYELFKFFNEQHGILLLESEIQDIIQAVEKFRENERIEAQREADLQLEEDDDFELTDNDDCEACGGFNGAHMKGCPEDHSPYAELLRNGYD